MRRRRRTARGEHVHPAGRVFHRLWRLQLRQHVCQPLDGPDRRLRQGGARAVRRGIRLCRLRPQRLERKPKPEPPAAAQGALRAHGVATAAGRERDDAPQARPCKSLGAPPAAAVPGRAAAR